LLLVNSRAGQKDSETMKLVLPSKHVDVLLIPDRTTKCQPLDVFFFRQYNIYVRRIEDHLRACLHDSRIKLHDRSFTVKMHPVVCDQLGASAYTNMLLYAWKKPGYAIHRTCDDLVNTIALSFNFGLETCLIDGCVTFALIVLSFIVPSMLSPILTCTLMMTCNNMSFSCESMIFAIVLITFNKHFRQY
jgi:hypothetical protein